MRAKLLMMLVVLALPATLPAADHGDAQTAYQRGARAYFAGRTDQAEELLTAAIEQHPEDPRGYYLRGLNRLRSGDLARAQADLREGARLEAEQGKAVAPVIDRSLAAVQGSARLTLERVRREARQQAEVDAHRQQLLRRKQARAEREARVLRTPYQLPIEALASRLTVDQARSVARKAPVEPAADDPFADDTPPNPDAAETTVDIPAEARGAVSRGALSRILGKTGENAAQTVGGIFGELAGQVMGGGDPMGPGPGGDPFGGLGEGGFEGEEFEGGDFDGGNFGPEGGNPFGAPDANPFGDDAAPEGNSFEMEEFEMQERSAPQAPAEEEEANPFF